MVHAGTRRGHPCLVAVSPDGGHLCAGHSAVKILTSVDALCAAFVSIPDGLPSLPCSPELLSRSLSYCFVDIVSMVAAKVVLKPIRILFRVIYSPHPQM